MHRVSTEPRTFSGQAWHVSACHCQAESVMQMLCWHSGWLDTLWVGLFVFCNPLTLLRSLTLYWRIILGETCREKGVGDGSGLSGHIVSG